MNMTSVVLLFASTLGSEQLFKVVNVIPAGALRGRQTTDPPVMPDYIVDPAIVVVEAVKPIAGQAGSSTGTFSEGRVQAPAVPVVEEQAPETQQLQQRSLRDEPGWTYHPRSRRTNRAHPPRTYQTRPPRSFSHYSKPYDRSRTHRSRGLRRYGQR
jgi:hypothetical protein